VVVTNYLGQELRRKQYNILTFAGAVNMLGLMHKNNYVHGDVRAVNIIFFADTTYLIDYDLSREVGGVYPQGYRGLEAGCGFEKRDPHATQGMKMKVEHDRYSMRYLMSHYTCDHPNKVDIIAQISSGTDLCEVANITLKQTPVTYKKLCRIIE
jgi:serine/threonine protein kinase